MIRRLVRHVLQLDEVERSMEQAFANWNKSFDDALEADCE